MEDLEASRDEPEVVLIDGEAVPAAPASLKITLDGGAQLFIQEYARTDLSRELGGIMLGAWQQDGEDLAVHVMAAVEARHAESGRASVRFTHRSWEYVNCVKDRFFPDLKIVGWFHTHPGFGIFLSGFDTFIQRNFFNLPWQVAYVIDPVARKDGFFCWQREGIVPCGYGLETGDYHNGGYVLGVGPASTAEQAPGRTPDDEQAPGGTPGEGQVIGMAPGEEQAPGRTPAAGKPAGGPVRFAPALIALICLGVVASASFYAGFTRGREQAARSLPAVAQQPGPAGQPGTLRQSNPAGQAGISPKPGSAQRPGVIYRHLVRDGDTLAGISRLYYHDSDRFRIIADYNHLADPNLLDVGQVLEIPDLQEGK